jgi:hypothetical protein
VEIRASDFERPLSFEFGENSRVISAEIVQTEPENLKPNISISSKGVLLKPLLLNSRDIISIKLLIAEYSGDIWGDVRVVGVKRLIRLKTAPSFEPAILVVINHLLLILCIVSFGFIVGYPLVFPGREVPPIISNMFFTTLRYFGGALGIFFQIDSAIADRRRLG